MKIDPGRFDAIIFDLGGVLLNIDFSLTQQALEKLGMNNVALYYGKYIQAGFFDRLDKGEIHEHELFHELRKLLDNNVTDDQLRQAWNAMILDFPFQRIQLLKKFKQTHRTFLLSNTNTVHYPVYQGILAGFGEDSIESLFHHVYLSFMEGMRKPDSDFFMKLITEQSLEPATTLFIDDTEMHVEAARNVGLQAIHLADGLDVVDLFGKW